ncbi:MAG: hypothetical protein ACPK85_14670 [Methanosarcina sp.]
MNVLKETDDEKIVSFKKEDGSIAYEIFWKDKKNPNRINFAFVDQDELVSEKLLSATNLNDSSVVTAAISTAKASFWNGSYAETYGSVSSGGVRIYLSERDSNYVIGSTALAGDVIGSAIATIYTKSSKVASVIGGLIAWAILSVYWDEQNDDGSLDIRIPYTSIAKALLYQPFKVKIGDSWYIL